MSLIYRYMIFDVTLNYQIISVKQKKKSIYAPLGLFDRCDGAQTVGMVIG